MGEVVEIDVDRSRYMTGLGDLAMLAWLAHGCRRVGKSLLFHRRRDTDLLDLLGVDHTPDPGGLPMDAIYLAELADRGKRPRLEYVRDGLGLDAGEAVRPSLAVPAEADEWAESEVATRGAPPVLLFPQTAWQPRAWPAPYWVDLSWQLHRAGLPVLVMLAYQDPRYLNTPVHHWGQSPARLAALVRRSACVVANDSFPAHLGAAVGGVPVFALCGPTRPECVFGHADNVTGLRAAGVDCGGCHFASPFRAACDQGCRALYALSPETVYARVLAAGRGGGPGTSRLELL